MKINIRKIDLNLLVALKVLLEERNVSRAAERLALTQPTVSGMLGRLRILFDDPLFVRTRHGMIPTKRAEDLAPALDKILHDAVSLVEPRSFEPGAAELDVSISANDYMQSALVVPLLSVLRRKAPGMRVAVRNAEVENLGRMLAQGQLDLAITTPELADPSLESVLLYREEYVCVVRSSHPLGSSRVSIRQFLKYDHVLMSPAGGLFRGPVDDALAELGSSRRVVLSVPSFLILLETLQTGDLIAHVPKRLLRGRKGALRMIRAPVDIDGFDVIAVWHQRSGHDRAHEWMRRQLLEVARVQAAKADAG